MSGSILIVAGEASGDLHGSNLIKALKEIDPALRFYGVGGEKMKGVGFSAIEDSKNLAVVGISEVILKLGRLYAAFNKLKKALDENRPDIVVLIDFPDFNLHVAKEADKRGIPVIYYIGPQVWAWRRRRVKKIARLVDKMLVVFPFEEDIYKKAGMDVEYVGHPLAGIVSCRLSKEDALSSLSMGHGRVVALLPGSRRHEVERLLPVMLEAAAIIKREIKDIQFILPLADTIEQTFIEEIIKNSQSLLTTCRDRFEIAIVRGRLYEVLRASDAAIVASGTATLETALMEVPMVIIYKVSILTSIIGRMFVRVDYIGLPNIVAGKWIVPELIQENARPELIAKDILKFLGNRDTRNSVISELKEMGKKLGSGDASKKAAEEIYSFLKSQESGLPLQAVGREVRSQKL
ncbi:MAG: lipid-A-disaccharide synthase [Deltaproteobacteria bacterium]|nr:lipid-A-disaccharide synthase [Deltaproteobacteria bacterium]